jgi:hypothetical protein
MCIHGVQYERAGLRRDSMGKSACDYCAATIPSSDFENGRAVVLLKKTYCRKCMERAVRQKTKNPSEYSGRHPAETPHC